jgi:hypothetical protein
MDDHRGAQITGLVTRASTGDKQAWDALWTGTPRSSTPLDAQQEIQGPDG